MRMCYCGGTEIDQFCSFLTSHFWLLQIDFVVKISVVTTSKPQKNNLREGFIQPPPPPL